MQMPSDAPMWRVGEIPVKVEEERSCMCKVSS